MMQGVNLPTRLTFGFLAIAAMSLSAFAARAADHPRMNALVANAFQYLAPCHGTVDPASGYLMEGWNQDLKEGLYLRSFTQLTAIGAWIDLLSDIAAGEADNPYISRTEALEKLQLVMRSLRHDQLDRRASVKGLLGNFLGFEGPHRVGPLAQDVPRHDVVAAFGEPRGSAIWNALDRQRWIVTQNNGQTGIVQRGTDYGASHFVGELAQFSDEATRTQLMDILDRRIVMAVYGDNANLSASIAQAIGALLRPNIRDNPKARQLRDEMEKFLEAQRPGYQFLFDPQTGLFRFGWDASAGRFFGWTDPQGHWRTGHSDYLFNEFRGPTMFVTLRYGLPKTAISNLGVKIKSYRMSDGRLIYTPAPWEGSAFQALGLGLSMAELRDPSWRVVLKNLVDIELDYAKRHRLPAFLSEAYSGRDREYTGALGIPEITVNSEPRITDAPSLYTLGVAYAIKPDEVERLLDANWDVISQLMTDHGPWEGYNTTTRKAVRFQTTVHVLSLILGALNKSSDNMTRYLDSRGLSGSLAALYTPGGNLDLLGDGVKAIAWTPDKSRVTLSRDPKGLRVHGDSVGQAGLTFVLPNAEGASLAGGTLTIRYAARHPIGMAIITLDRKEPALREAGVIPSEIFLDTSRETAVVTASGEMEWTAQVALPATPALTGIREVALLCGDREKRGPFDLSFTAFRFVPFGPQ
ncbi:MAG: hypothetical protein ABFC96_07525 [Thermoguttaceae bacterium]